MACQNCWSWDAPLLLHSQRSVDGHLIGMRYEQWLQYHAHVNIHQRHPDGTHQWGGELTPVERQS